MANFPDTEHYLGDLHAADLEGFPAADLFWASPECPQWSLARGRWREFDKQPDLFGEVLGDEAADRSRALISNSVGRHEESPDGAKYPPSIWAALPLSSEPAHLTQIGAFCTFAGSIREKMRLRLAVR